MKKIVKKPIYYKTVCDKCGCEFSYEYEDIKFSSFSGCLMVECPICQYNSEHTKENFVYKGENK